MSAVTEKRVFLDVTVDGKPAGRIEIKLFVEEAPKTCENFRALCTGEVGMAPNNKARLHYKGNQIHRVVKKFMIQGGDITEGDGRGGYSIYGRYFDDEKFILKHTKPYLLSMANKGPNSNSSQFFITTAPAPHCNGKHVVFGEVIRGQQVVDLIEDLETDDGAKPKSVVEISNSGELIKKQKKAPVQEDCQNAAKQDENSNIPEGPKSWLYRNDDTEERGDKRRDERVAYSRKNDNRDYRRDDRKDSRRDDHRDDRRDDRRHERDRRRRSRTWSRSPDRRRDERGDHRDRKHVHDSGVRVRGRGGVRYRKERSLTPEHWRKNAPKKHVPRRSNGSERSEMSIEERYR